MDLRRSGSNEAAPDQQKMTGPAILTAANSRQACRPMYGEEYGKPFPIQLEADCLGRA